MCVQLAWPLHVPRMSCLSCSQCVLYVLTDPCSQFQHNWLHHCSSTGFPIRLFNHKIFNCVVFSNLFSSHTLDPCEWTCSLWFNLFGMLVFLISQPCLTRFHWNLRHPLPYAYSTSLAIFRLILLCSVIADHNLHSRAKFSITQNQDCCFS